jgi:hypothetical protein
MAKNKNIKYHWIYLFGTPERIREEYFIDDYGTWDSQFYRKDGSPMSFKPSPLDLFKDKKHLERHLSYLSRLRKATLKIRY